MFLLLKNKSKLLLLPIICGAVAFFVACSKPDNPSSPIIDTPPPLPPTPVHVPSWELDFEDNFDGSSVDGKSWSMYNSAGHNSNGLRHPSAYSIQGGSLVVTAQMLDVEDNKVMINGQSFTLPNSCKLSKDGKKILVSGGMAHKKEYAPGTKFEFRVKCDKDPSNTLSAVILTWPKSGSDRNARCEESDIYETGSSTGAQRNKISSFFHYGLHPNVNGGKVTQKQKDYTCDATQWHTMAYEWYADKVNVYLDNELVWTITDSSVVPIYSHHLCIQLDAFGTQLESAASVVRMYVDWVKIYVAK